jgi:hypothetical protein
LSPYEHFFWNYAIFYRKPWAWKVGLGGVFPDLVYMVAFIPKLFAYHNFREWMMDPLWGRVWNSLIAKSLHSFVIWAAVVLFIFLIKAISGKKNIFMFIFPFLIGWGLHIAADALTHVSDSYAIFFPLSSYRFPAPVSYWEPAFHGREFFWISHCLMIGLLLLWIVPKLKKKRVTS